jgi:hypothetical protein
LPWLAPPDCSSSSTSVCPRRQNDDPRSAILSADPTASISAVSAALASAAAYPFLPSVHFEKLELYSGGFKSACPAEAAKGEANRIWPKRSMDILVSLGTGRHEQSQKDVNLSHQELQLKDAIVNTLINPHQEWTSFAEEHDGNSNALRLDPCWDSDKQIPALYDSQMLSSIAYVTLQWLARPVVSQTVTIIADRLLASLFYFEPADSSGLEQGNFRGVIKCKLPADLEARNGLVRKFIEAFNGNSTRRNVFEVEPCHSPKKPERIPDAEETFKRLRKGDEFALPVAVAEYPTTGRRQIKITFCNITDPDSGERYPISGCPITLPGGTVDVMIYQ